MPSFYKAGAAVCLVALWALPAAASGKTYKFTAVEVKEDAYLAANLARNGKLPVRISEVTKDEDLVAAVNALLEREETATEQTCKELIGDSELNSMFHYAFDYKADTTPDYYELLQGALTAGLDAFKETGYPKESEKWETIWSNEAGANLAHLLASNSTQIGCVIGKCTETTVQSPIVSRGTVDAKTEKAVLFCKLKPAATVNQAPFGEDYFNGLTARTTLLKNMTEDDLKAPAEDGAAATATPTILMAGLAAMLTAISV